MIVNKKPFMTKKYLMIVLVSIVTGYIIGYSYNLSKDRRESGTITSAEYQKESAYRQQLIDQQERNKQLVDELSLLEDKLRQFEQQVASEEQHYNDLLSEVNEIRFLLGHLPAKGEGVRIQLEDGDYNPLSTNPNDYIIHESHLFKLINELKIAGAEGIAVNGQRLHANSYIVCNGPVITIDGKQYPAPFTVEAIGNKETLVQALELTGGVVDQLLNDQIKITIEKRDQITLKSINGDA
jgi:uncharacterized protein YlxW (UPF0749 family)